MFNLYGFMHICTINDWKIIVEEQLQKIIDSGLYNKLTSLFCGVVGDQNIDFLSELSKIKILYKDPDITNFEFKTLESLQNFCNTQAPLGSKVFYIHTKGISKHGKNKPISDLFKEYAQDWRKYMDHFIIEKHEECIKQMDNNTDIVGVNWRGIGTTFTQSRNNHFSGNFWWAKSKYIKQLGRIRDGNGGRCEAEFWIGKGNGVSVSLFETNINHYKQNYPENNYKNKIQLSKWQFEKGRSQIIKEI